MAAKQQAAAAAPAAPEQPAMAEPVAAGMSPDQIESLKQLAELKEQGILTEEEFAAQKAMILGS
jgi:hypothetical protein